MMSIGCIVQYNTESSRPPDREKWKLAREAKDLSAKDDLAGFRYPPFRRSCTHWKTARIADGIMTATSSSPRVARTAFGAGAGGMRPCSRNDGLLTDEIHIFVAHLLLACSSMGMVAAIFRCSFVHPHASPVLCPCLLARARSVS